MEYATDTALDHMIVMDENESQIEVHITQSRHFHFKGFTGVRYQERNRWCNELQGARSRSIDWEGPYGSI
jgi:hypothetical protein